MFLIELNTNHNLPFSNFQCHFFVGQYHFPLRNFRKSGFHQDNISDILVRVLKS